MTKVRLTGRNEIFNQQARSEIVSSRYDLSVRRSGSYAMGVLYPIFCRDDINPGDKFKLGSAPFIRFLPLVSPALTNVDVEVRYFFVPRRILWSQWKQFISPSTSDDAALIEPYIYNFEENSENKSYDVFYNVAGSIYDYMGCSSIPWNRNYVTVGGSNIIGTRVVGSSLNSYNMKTMLGHYAPAMNFAKADLPVNVHPRHFSAYPFLAYNAIWNEYFRDENLQNEVLAHVTTGGNHHGYNFCLKRVNWEKDYFSSALPFVTQQIFSTPQVSNGMSIEDLRETSALTKWLELQAIGGHRYQESILTHFGVRVPDEAAQIPVYLGGGRVPVSVGSVEQNSPGLENETPLATLAGRAQSSGNLFVDSFEFKEHGTILGLMYIRPKALYSDVTPKDLLSKSSRHDYYWPAFANLGDEAVKSDELNPGFFEYGLNNDFGYQMRYASYRTSFDQVSGQLRPGESLESWTQARSWIDLSNGWAGSIVNPIQISSSFIECQPSDRIFAVVDDGSQIWFPLDNMVGEIITFVDAVRPLPNYVDPKLD